MSLVLKRQREVIIQDPNNPEDEGIIKLKRVKPNGEIDLRPQQRKKISKTEQEKLVKDKQAWERVIKILRDKKAQRRDLNMFRKFKKQVTELIVPRDSEIALKKHVSAEPVSFLSKLGSIQKMSPFLISNLLEKLAPKHAPEDDLPQPEVRSAPAQSQPIAQPLNVSSSTEPQIRQDSVNQDSGASAAAQVAPAAQAAADEPQAETVEDLKAQIEELRQKYEQATTAQTSGETNEQQKQQIETLMYKLADLESTNEGLNQLYSKLREAAIQAGVDVTALENGDKKPVVPQAPTAPPPPGPQYTGPRDKYGNADYSKIDVTKYTPELLAKVREEAIENRATKIIKHLQEQLTDEFRPKIARAYKILAAVQNNDPQYAEALQTPEIMNKFIAEMSQYVKNLETKIKEAEQAPEYYFSRVRAEIEAEEAKNKKIAEDKQIKKKKEKEKLATLNMDEMRDKYALSYLIWTNQAKTYEARGEKIPTTYNEMIPEHQIRFDEWFKKNVLPNLDLSAEDWEKLVAKQEEQNKDKPADLSTEEKEALIQAYIEHKVREDPENEASVRLRLNKFLHASNDKEFTSPGAKEAYGIEMREFNKWRKTYERLSPEERQAKEEEEKAAAEKEKEEHQRKSEHETAKRDFYNDFYNFLKESEQELPSFGPKAREYKTTEDFMRSNKRFKGKGRITTKTRRKVSRRRKLPYSFSVLFR